MADQPQPLIEDEPRFLDPRPPHWAASGLSYVLIALAGLGVLGAVLVNVPERIATRFVLVPEGGTDPVRSPRDGTVIEVALREGQTVTAGDTAFVLQSAEVGDRFAELGGLEARVAGLDESLRNAAEREASQRRADDEELHRLDGRLEHADRMDALRGEQLALKQQEARRYSELYKKGFSDELTFRNAELEVSQASIEAEEARADHAETLSLKSRLEHEIAARQSEYEESKRGLEEERQRYEIRITSLRDDLRKSSGNQETVSVPCAGTILRLAINAAGAVVEQGDVLCELACSGEVLRAELSLPQNGLDRIRPGQTVRLLYDAFPYQRYGVRRGVVSWVSPAGLTSDTGPSFLAFVDLDDTSVRVEGVERALHAGMAGRAEVVTGKRSLVSFAFEPLRQLRENLDTDG